MLLAAPALGDIRSNTPLRPELDLGTDLSASGHVVIDFGDDALTVGRAHPMIDPTLRLEAIAALAASDEPAVLLLDVVLGYGADPDPAASLVPGADRRPRARAAAARGGRAGRHRGRPAGLEPPGRRPRRRRRRRLRLQLRRHAVRPRPAGSLLDDAWADCCPPRRRSSPRASTSSPTRCAPRAPRCTTSTGGRRASATPPTSPRSPSTRAGRRPTGRPSSGCWPRARSWSTSGPAREVIGLADRTLLHSGPPLDLGDRLRPDARRADRRLPVRGLGVDRRGRRADPGRRRDHARPVPPPPHRRPDGRRDQPVDVDVVPRGPGQRRRGVLQPQRGPRQGAADGRLQRRGASTRLRWMRDVLGPVLSRRGARPIERTTRWTSRRSSPRCCRWATRGTTATAPGR